MFTQPILALGIGSVALIALLAIIVILVLYVISCQRALVRLEEMLKNTLGQIAVQVNSRWDALTQLAKVVASYSQYEHDTLVEVIRERRQSVSASDVSQVQEQINASNSVLDRLFALAENYPQLRASENYQQLQDSINVYENNVRLQRMVYNDAATRYNNMVRMFPSNIIARMFGYGVKDYFKEEAGKDTMPDLNLDFKKKD